MLVMKANVLLNLVISMSDLILALKAENCFKELIFFLIDILLSIFPKLCDLSMLCLYI